MKQLGPDVLDLWASVLFDDYHKASQRLYE